MITIIILLAWKSGFRMMVYQQLIPELLIERQSSLNVLRDLPELLQSLERYDSFSEHFIHNLITDSGDKFDFR